MLLQSILKTHVFGQLRTKEQLGYIVQLTVRRIGKVPSLSFLVQSSTKCPQFVSSRIEEFVRRAVEVVDSISESEFDAFKEGILVSYKKKPLTVYEEASLWNGIIEGQTMEFDLKDKLIKDLVTVTKKDVKELAERLLEKERRILEIHLVSRSHEEEQGKLIEERKNVQQGKTLVTSNYNHVRNQLK